MNFELIYSNFFIILSGLDETLKLVIISLSLGFIISIPFALARASSIKILSQSVYYYVFIIRGTPLLVQIYLIYYGLGTILFIRESFLWIVLKDPFFCGILALVINTVAYTAEIFRGGIQSVTIIKLDSLIKQKKPQQYLDTTTNLVNGMKEVIKFLIKSIKQKK